MNDAQRTIEHISGTRGQHEHLDDLLGELWPDHDGTGSAVPELLSEYRGAAGRWEVRVHQVYRFPDDSLADLAQSVPLGPDGNDVQPQCAGTVVYAVARQVVEYLTGDQRNALGLLERKDYRQPVDHATEWALGYWRAGQRVTLESIGSGDHAERLARGYHAKQADPTQLALTTWERVTLEARDVYLAPWHTIDTPTTGTSTDQPSTSSTPQTTGQK